MLSSLIAHRQQEIRAYADALDLAKIESYAASKLRESIESIREELATSAAQMARQPSSKISRERYRKRALSRHFINLKTSSTVEIWQDAYERQIAEATNEGDSLWDQVRRAPLSVQVQSRDTLQVKLAPERYMNVTNTVSREFCDLADSLQAGDTYLTVTTIPFWLSDAIQQSDFAERNMSACRRGAFIRRLLVVDPSEGEVREQKAKDILARMAQPHTAAPHMAIRILRLNHKEYIKCMSEVGHCAIATYKERPSARSFIAPTYSPDAGDRMVGFTKVAVESMDDPNFAIIGSRMDRFHELWGRAEDFSACTKDKPTAASQTWG